MQTNITTIYNIGDILYLQQTNGGGLRKVCVTEICVSLRSNKILYIFNKAAALDTRRWYTHSSHKWEEDNVVHGVKYARRGNTWLTEKPPKKPKPVDETRQAKFMREVLKYWGL